MNTLKNKNIILCVTGSIAAYKACEVLRLLRKEGANVQVIMSKTGRWVLQMEEDAQDMTREEFIKKHGLYGVDIWDSIHNEMIDESDEPFDISIQK